MKRMMIGITASIMLVALSGCAALKECRQENLTLKSTIDQMTQENEKLAAESRACQDSLQAKQKELDLRKQELKSKEQAVQEQSSAFKQMQSAMKAELASQQVAIKELEGKLTLSMVESILFDSGKADVKTDGQEALKKVAEVLKGTVDQDIVVAGYTDNVPIKGLLAQTFPTNWELSAARAISVVKILEADGVDPKLLSATGYSEFRPVAENDTPEGRAKNRRMEIILMPKRSQ
jgi:chemotaxis protein MotB